LKNPSTAEYAENAEKFLLKNSAISAFSAVKRVFSGSAVNLRLIFNTSVV